ncbi:hypothetical protein DFJ77DRAFT_22730 [Powellomyces hirtus]|nr:hypothetical protein DFJ77DRAFT_22730 [Powellomyces hirtus]
MKITAILVVACAVREAWARPAVFARQSTACPECIPAAGQNTCDVTTSCIPAPAGPALGKSFCGCRAGFKSSAPDDDLTSHWRLPGPNRVYVAAGASCNTPCSISAAGEYCAEVGIRDLDICAASTEASPSQTSGGTTPAAPSVIAVSTLTSTTPDVAILTIA